MRSLLGNGLHTRGLSATHHRRKEVHLANQCKGRHHAPSQQATTVQAPLEDILLNAMEARLLEVHTVHISLSTHRRANMATTRDTVALLEDTVHTVNSLPVEGQHLMRKKIQVQKRSQFNKKAEKESGEAPRLKRKSRPQRKRNHCLRKQR